MANAAANSAFGNIKYEDLDLDPNRPPPYLYLSTLKPSTATFESILASFASPDSHNLILK